MLGALAKRVQRLSATAASTAVSVSSRLASASAASAAAPTTAAPARAAAAALTGARPWGPTSALGGSRRLSTEAGDAAAELPLEALEKAKPPRNSLVGMVVSDRMDKSIVVRVSRIKLFLPYMVRKRTFKKIMAHDEGNECGMGDIVRIKPSRPLSKRKAFTLHEVIRKDPKLSLQQQQAGAAGAGKSSSQAAGASASS